MWNRQIENRPMVETPPEGKQETRKRLLRCAKDEFLEKGFEKASLRRICQRAGLTTGAVYFFFDSKEDLFYQIVGDVARHLEELGRSLSSAELNQPDIGVDCDIRFMEFLYRKRQEVLLLMEKSQKTRYASFCEEVYSRMQKTFLLFFQHYGVPEADPQLVRILVEMRMKGLLEILKGDYTMEQVLTLTRQVGIYADSGFWQLAASMKQQLDKN